MPAAVASASSPASWGADIASTYLVEIHIEQDHRRPIGAGQVKTWPGPG